VKPLVGAVRASITVLEREQIRAFFEIVADGESRLEIVRVYVVEIRSSEHPFSRVAERFLPRGIETLELVVEIRHAQHVDG